MKSLQTALSEEDIMTIDLFIADTVKTRFDE
jgi:hypothetical protein